MGDKPGQLSRYSLRTRETQTPCGSTIRSYFRDTAVRTSSGKPVLVLIHGYPQTSFIWRHLIKLLPPEYALFIPDIPGYGLSTPSTKGDDKRTIGEAILSALSSSLTRKHPQEPIPIVLIGHDRGARICHRLAVDFANPGAASSSKRPIITNFALKGTVLLDTVPELTQWRSFASASAAVGSFHWPFLANVAQATAMIGAYGGGAWCRDLIARWAGSNPAGLEALHADDALEAYAVAFEDERVVRATCRDYEAGAGVDVERQVEDQREGRKMGGKVLVLFSEGYLGRRVDVGEAWKEWMMEGAELRFVGVGDGVGHFIVEEAASEVAEVLKSWLKGV